MNRPNLLIVGSVGLDTVSTPFGSVDRVLGGTAVYASCAASALCRPAVVGVVGDDFPLHYADLMKSKGIDLTCLETMPGSTFHWIGSYEGDMNVAITQDTRLGVFADFSPKIPDSHRNVPYLFLGNIHPQLQLDVLDRMTGHPVAAADSMNYWIERTPDLLRRVIERVAIILLNDGEVRMISGKSNILEAADHILNMGPKVVVVKKGSHGSMLMMKDHIIEVPAVPLRTAKDPTGAGDTFAGGFMGFVAKQGNCSTETLEQAMVMGTVMASFTVEDFSLNRLVSVDRKTVAGRVEQIHTLIKRES